MQNKCKCFPTHPLFHPISHNLHPSGPIFDQFCDFLSFLSDCKGHSFVRMLHSKTVFHLSFSTTHFSSSFFGTPLQACCMPTEINETESGRVSICAYMRAWAGGVIIHVLLWDQSGITISFLFSPFLLFLLHSFSSHFWVSDHFLGIDFDTSRNRYSDIRLLWDGDHYRVDKL